VADDRARRTGRPARLKSGLTSTVAAGSAVTDSRGEAQVATGRVKFYDAKQGFGYLSQDGGPDVHVRKTALADGAEGLRSGTRVEFEVTEGPRGPQEHPDLVKDWIRAHVEVTDWIGAHLPEAKKLLNMQIQKETGKPLAEGLLNDAFGRLTVTYDPLRSSLMTAAKSAFDAGFLGRQMPDLSSLYDLSLLNQVLAEKGKKAIQ